MSEMEENTLPSEQLGSKNLFPKRQLTLIMAKQLVLPLEALKRTLKRETTEGQQHEHYYFVHHEKHQGYASRPSS